jgi:predicted KAP-like P-loop ATPase
MWSDNETDIDFLGFQHLVDAAASIVRNGSLLPATIGVFGDWGSGKSSLLSLVRKELEKDKDDILVLHFNGWLFEGYHDTKTALIGSVLDALADNKTIFNKVRGKVVRLIKRLDFIALAKTAARAGVGYVLAGDIGAGIAVASDPTALRAALEKQAKELGDELKDMKPEDIEKLERYIKDDVGHELRRGIRQFRHDFADLLNETACKAVVVVIDDLDRCMPDTIIEALEAIKLFLFVPKTAFIIGADERLVQYAVRRRFPELPGQRVDVGRDYLEKLIQYPIRVPPLGRGEIETYINILFAQTAKLKPEHFESLRTRATTCDPTALLAARVNTGIAREVLGTIPPDLTDGLSLAESITPMLAQGTSGNPRQCKRFLNTLILRMQMAKSRGIELKRRVLAKLMLLEYFRSASFTQLAELQASQGGRPRELADAEKAVRTLPKQEKNTPKKESKDNPSSETDENTMLPVWLSDPWAREWLLLEPTLAAENLQPYFFFSRDALGITSGAAKRMSPSAQELLEQLVHPADAVRAQADKRASEVTGVDAAAIFEALAERAREEEAPEEKHSALRAMFHWVELRRELLSQLVTLLGSFPDARLPLWVLSALQAATKGSEVHQAARALVDQWSKSAANGAFRSLAQKLLPNF